MYCTYCGALNPKGFEFCHACGKPAPSTDASTADLPRSTESPVPISTHPANESAPPMSYSPRRPTSYEYKDYAYSLSGWYLNYSPTQARLEAWKSVQSNVRRELQKWFDEGWEPVSEVGPASVTVRSFKAIEGTKRNPIRGSLTSSIVLWLWIVGVIGTVGLLFLFVPLRVSDYLEPTEIRIQMKRSLY
jgi:hypothetical protein